MEEDGSVRVNDILKLDQYQGCSLDMIQKIVEVHQKSRYHLDCRQGIWWISANQGHDKSVAKELKAETYLQPLTEALPLVLHGTYSEHLASITKTGLKAQSRGYIHCAQDLPQKVKSGMRQDCNLVVKINMELALKDGYKFFKSRNDVILIEGDLPAKYLQIDQI
jgi:2'-phosphotransferase